MNVSHASSQKTEYYTVRFDKKEFRVKVIECQRHHKDYPEITDIEVRQVPSMEDDNLVRKKIIEYEKKIIEYEKEKRR